VPRLVMQPQRRTTGIRVPEHSICLALLETLGNPIVSTSAHLLSEEEAELVTGQQRNACVLPVITTDHGLSKAELFDRLHNIVDVIVDNGLEPGYNVSTILDLTEPTPVVVRKGLGWEEVADWLMLGVD